MPTTSSEAALRDAWARAQVQLGEEIRRGIRLVREREACRDVLRLLEWTGKHIEFPKAPACPICGNAEVEGHYQGCDLALALGLQEED